MPREPVLLPVFLRLAGARTLVVGGGRVALRRCRDLRAAGADVRVVSPRFCAPLRRLEGVHRVRRPFRASDVVGTRLVFAAAGDADVNRRAAAAAARHGVAVNVSDAPDLSTFSMPAVCRRGRIALAVSTSGASPALARRLRDRLAKGIGPASARHANFLARARDRVKRRVQDPCRRRAILVRLAEEDVCEMIRSGRRNEANALLRRLLKEVGRDTRRSP